MPSPLSSRLASVIIVFSSFGTVAVVFWTQHLTVLSLASTATKVGFSVKKSRPKKTSTSSASHLVFNDDIQVANVNAVAYSNLRKTLADYTFLLLGAGEVGIGIAKLIALEISKQVGTGIAKLIALQISKQTKAPVEETRKKIWLVNSIL
ncbi:hypothetical protein Ahy_A07g036790 [Arachis hypogaea]|uniref:Uncharacterized protein n=1 Tax=Arachis hypogaea TaxID=3818 RepID=A0A445CGZ7_ARAHY|nr:hypothetical protein Ahy_A07g036790 [Arachis hypogaea]